MIQSNQKQSLLVPYELPKFISEDPNYANFTLFLKAYYEWMEQQNNVLDYSKSLLQDMDVDTTTQQFLQYFINDFMSYFPQDILSDPRKVLKIAKQLYQSKGTPASYQFLFRLLYNTDVDFFYTKDAVFSPSSGKWYVPRSLKLATSDPNFLNIQNLRMFGNFSKSIATVEAATYDGKKTEVFISNIERLFQSGETVTVVDNRNQPVYFYEGKIVSANTVGAETLTATIVGQISQVLINPKARGLYYNTNDPVVFIGGLNPNVLNPTGAVAEVGAVTVGSIQSITVQNGGYGYYYSTPNNTPGAANTEVLFTNVVGTNQPQAPIAVVAGVDTTQLANATFIPIDSLILKENITLGNTNYYFNAGNYLTVPQPIQFANNEFVYQGTSNATSTFNGQVTNMDPANNVLLLVQHTRGTINNTAPLIGVNTGAVRYLLAYEGEGTNNVRIQYANGQFYIGEGVYQGSNLANSTFSASISSINTNVGGGNNIIQLSSVVGTINIGQQLHGYLSGVNANTLLFTTANANTKMSDAFTFASFPTYPITSIIVENQGGGLTQAPTVAVESLYIEDEFSQSNLANLGILAPVQIINAGTGYQVNDQILFLGGTGVGANAIITSCNNTTGSITGIQYVPYVIGNTANPYPLGGMGYFNGLPDVVVKRLASGNVKVSNTSTVVVGNGTNFLTQMTVGAPLTTNTNIVIGTVQSIVNANTLLLTSNATTNNVATNFYQGSAILAAPGYLGSGATFTSVANRIGEITNFNIIDNGSDYISAPQISLVVQDLIVANVSQLDLPTAGQIIYQGANTNVATYTATVDSLFVVENAYPTSNTVYQLRVYNYTAKPNFNLPLKIDATGANYRLVPNFTNIHTTSFINTGDDSRFDSANGVMTYGDGHAKANATFLNGLAIGNGEYLDNTGWPSAFSVLQSTKYNNFTYEITLEKEIAKYRDVLLNLLHPSGMQAIGRYAMKSNASFNLSTIDAIQTGVPLDHYANTGTIATIVGGTADVPSNNIIVFGNLYGANLHNIFFANTTTINFEYGSNPDDCVVSLVIGVDGTSITLQDNVWTYFANVATSTWLNSNNYTLNITSLTGSYDIVNNGFYSNTAYPMEDVIRVGDSVYVNGVSAVVTVVDYNYSYDNNGNIISYGTVDLNGPLTAGANGLVSISRTMVSLYEDIQIYGPVGVQYFVELTTEDGNTLTDEQGNALLIG